MLLDSLLQSPVILHREVPRGAACPIHTEERRRAILAGANFCGAARYRVQSSTQTKFSNKSCSEKSESKKRRRAVTRGEKMNKRTSDVQSQFAKLFKDISSRKLAPGTSIGHPTAFPIIKNKGAKVQQSSPDIIHKKTAMLQVPPSNFFPLIKKKSLTTKKTNAADDAVSASLNKSRMTKNQTELVGQAKNATAKSAIKSVGVEESKQPAQGSKKRKMRLRKSLSIYRFLLIITGVVIVLLASSLIFVLVFLLGMERPYALGDSMQIRITIN
uniref:Uncharacterized protein n=1 Tax=Romanomermis culicivorax TaxID=13658 RepID=A0A915HM58_ROMCU